MAAVSQTFTGATLPPASAFGRYALLDRLGAGGMGDVFLALSSGPFDAKKLVVLKRPRDADHELTAMFLDEARLAMRLSHPNIVQTYDVGVDAGAFFLAMEFLEGQPLHRIVQAMRRARLFLSHTQLARIVSDALAGLHYAHELRDYDGAALHIVHRDVSPHNVFVTYDGRVKVVDFGVAQATMNLVRTQTGAIKGKLAYMAPEQANAQRVDGRADVFAMGVILWELVAQQRLFTGATNAELLSRLFKMEIPLLSSEVPDVHPILEAIAMRALERDPDERYGSALEMRDALESYISATGEAVRSADIGGMVETLFATERQRMAQTIQAHMRSAATATPESARPAGAERPTEITPNDPHATTATVIQPQAVIHPGARPRAPWWVFVAMVALPVASAGLFLLTWTKKNHPMPMPPDHHVPVAPVAPVAPVNPSALPQNPPITPERVEFPVAWKRERLVPSPLRGVWAQVAYPADARAVAVGDHGTIAMRESGGWVVTPAPTTATLRAVTSGRDLIAVGDHGTIVVFDPIARKWSLEPSGTTEDLRSVTEGSLAGSIAVGAHGTILVRRPRTDHEVTRWTPVLTGVTADLRTVRQIDNTIIVVGTNGTILTSDVQSHGLYQLRDSGTNVTLSSIGRSDNAPIVGGAGGLLLRGESDGSWKPWASPVTGDVQALAGADMFALGYRPQLRPVGTWGIALVLSTKDGTWLRPAGPLQGMQGVVPEWARVGQGDEVHGITGLANCIEAAFAVTDSGEIWRLGRR